jgi:hypothetical protein
MKSLGRMPVSGTVPPHSFLLKPGDYQLITFYVHLMLSSKQKREDRRLDGITMGGGWSLRRKRSAQDEEKKWR